MVMNTPANFNDETKLLSDIRTLIESSKVQVAIAVNSSMALLYWHIGSRINRELLGGERAEYGKRVIAQLSQQLTLQYGGNQFSEKNLNRMRLFAQRFSDISIWTPLVSKLSWSHFLQVIPIEDKLAASSFVGRRLFKRLCKSDYFTLSANSAPALNLMVLRAGMVMDSLVRGLMPVRSPFSVTAKVPNPSRATLSPSARAPAIASIVASREALAWALVRPAFSAIAEMSSDLFMGLS